MKTKKSTSEVGHAKNVTNFKALIQLLQEMGPLYQPYNTQIKIADLLTLSSQLDVSIQNLADKTAPFKTAVANRENGFLPLRKLSTRIKNSFNSLGLSKAENDNVMALVKKIRGDQAKATNPNPENQDTQTISNAQMSYTNRATNLQTLISLLTSYPNYTPNEDDLKITGLNNLYTQLKDLNTIATEKTYELITARKQRNDLLYNNPVNLLDLVGPIKDYLKSIEGAADYYRAAVNLKFRRMS
ncbi:hypothetical protein [Flavobacterium sp. XGLA_31]|uniref:hypothetical protein n=1 Tax=Flavobacterium sp. XGLA_31 TaxID=3447666 RepID=UPI003F32CE43